MGTNQKYANGAGITIITIACVVFNKGLLLNWFVFAFVHKPYKYYYNDS